MATKVCFFGATAQLVGKNEITVLTDGSTVSEIVQRLGIDFPELAKLNLKFAVNNEYASADTEVGVADELAIFTAVSGG